MAIYIKKYLSAFFFTTLLIYPFSSIGGPVDAIEFFEPVLGHYVISAGAGEIEDIDNGRAGPHWVRTGQSFKVWYSQADGPPATAVQMCRFYTFGANSHFYAWGQECDDLRAQNPRNDHNPDLWVYEGMAFWVEIPNEQGTCPQGLIPVIRSYNNRFAERDSNHRFSTLDSVSAEMTSLGWTKEGIAMCTQEAGTNNGESPLQVSAAVRTDTETTLTTGDGASLYVPVGAVAPSPTGAIGNITITMALDTTTRVNIPTGTSLASRVYRLTPSGHVFEGGLEASLPVPPDVNGDELMIVAQSEDENRTVERLVSSFDPETRTITAQIPHFSSTFGLTPNNDAGRVPGVSYYVINPTNGERKPYGCIHLINGSGNSSATESKRLCVETVNNYTYPGWLNSNVGSGGAVILSNPLDATGFQPAPWWLPPGNYNICTEVWDRDGPFGTVYSGIFRGSHIYNNIQINSMTGSSGISGEWCNTTLAVANARNEQPFGPNRCTCGGTVVPPTPGGTGGPLEVSLKWETPQESGVDLDLHLYEPSGEHIYYSHLVSATGGTLDWDNRCGNYVAGKTENISWANPPPDGVYRIEVHWWGSCAANSPSTLSINVNVTANGATRSYTQTISKGERVTIAEIPYNGTTAGVIWNGRGYATYDGQNASMELKFSGANVTGSLKKDGACEPNIRLTETRLTLTGTIVSGNWSDGTATINGNWTGGDWLCGDWLTATNGYPRNGTFTISRQGNNIRLLRTGPTPVLPTGWTYDFTTN